MKNKIFASGFFMIFCLIGCDSEAPACTTLSWGETKIEETGFDLKYSAGNQCKNINDYYDVNVDEMISKFQKMKFVLNDTCREENYETGEEEVVDCPDFVAETIEFGNVVKCRFDTPPAENTDCAVGPLGLTFDGIPLYETATWVLDDFQSEDAVEKGYFNMGTETIKAYSIGSDITYEWTETSSEGAEEKKLIKLNYSVEIKE